MEEAVTAGGTPPSLTQREISTFSNEYKARRKQQMLRFFGATAITLISCRLAYRGIQSRRCMFNYFFNLYFLIFPTIIY